MQRKRADQLQIGDTIAFTNEKVIAIELASAKLDPNKVAVILENPKSGKRQAIWNKSTQISLR